MVLKVSSGLSVMRPENIEIHEVENSGHSKTELAFVTFETESNKWGLFVYSIPYIYNRLERELEEPEPQPDLCVMSIDLTTIQDILTQKASSGFPDHWKL